MVVVNERAQDYGGRAARYELQLQLVTAINDPKMTIEQLQRITNDYPVSGDVSSDNPVSYDVSSNYPVSGDVSSDYLVSGGIGNIGAYYQFHHVHVIVFCVHACLLHQDIGRTVL